jgi:carboxypeptidase family protein
VTQASTGTISGSVRADNATGAGVAGATVEVLKAGTTLTDTNSDNIVATGATDASGNYIIAFVPPGTYVVRATPTVASGYKPALLTGGAIVTAGVTLSDQVIVVTK